MIKIKGKKADQTLWIISMVFFLGIAISIYLLQQSANEYDEVSKGLKVGERQFSLFTTYSHGEIALFYVDRASELSVGRAYAELAENGGYGYEYDELLKAHFTSSPCGTYKGFTLWKNGNKDCYPSREDAEKNYFNTLTNRLNDYYSSYKEAKIPADYSFAIKNGELIGKANSEIIFRSNEKAENSVRQQDYYTYKIKPSFRQKFRYSFDVYDELAKKAGGISERCRDAANFETCANSFNGQTVSGLKLDVGCGEKADEMQKAVKVCVNNKDIDYRFALKMSSKELGNCKLGSLIGQFKITSYYTPREEEFATYSDFQKEVRMQGSGILSDGRILRYNGEIMDTNGIFYNGVTASGTNPTEKKTIAVDPNTIRLGSNVFIDFGNGNEYSTVYTAEDTGGAIKGSRIDVFRGAGRNTLIPGLPETADVYRAICED